MNIRDYSSQFTVYVFTTNVDLGASAKVYLAQAGYDAFFFQDAALLEQGLRKPSASFGFSTAGLTGLLNDFVGLVQEINPEIHFIAMAPTTQFEVLAQYNTHGFVDVLSDEGASVESRIVWAVDRACEKIYLSYQNEQLFDDLQKTKEKMEEIHSAAVTSMKQVEAEPVENTKPQIAKSLTDYRTAQSKEDMIQKYLNHLHQHLCVFFKFLPTVRSLWRHMPTVFLLQIFKVSECNFTRKTFVIFPLNWQ